MIYIRIPSTFRGGEDAELQSLGIETEGIHTFTYLNVADCSVGPFITDEGDIKRDKCMLLTNTGQSLLVLPMSPEKYLNLIGGKCILEL